MEPHTRHAPALAFLSPGFSIHLQYKLHQYAKLTLGSGDMHLAVRLPEGEDENEWLAVVRPTAPERGDARVCLTPRLPLDLLHLPACRPV